MSAISKMLERRNAVRDLETIPMTRGQLVQLLVRVHLAEGMNYAKADTFARMLVDQAFFQLKAS